MIQSLQYLIWFNLWNIFNTWSDSILIRFNLWNSTWYFQYLVWFNQPDLNTQSEIQPELFNLEAIHLFWEIWEWHLSLKFLMKVCLHNIILLICWYHIILKYIATSLPSVRSIILYEQSIMIMLLKTPEKSDKLQAIIMIMLLNSLWSVWKPFQYKSDLN